LIYCRRFLIRAMRLAEVVSALITRDRATVPSIAAASEPSRHPCWVAAIALCRLGCSILLLAATIATRPAFAVPSFAVQTGQPCASCHIGAFGPHLTPQGRDFKLHGYVGSDGQDHGLPLAFTTQSSFTHTQVPQPGGAAPGFKPNDNVAIDQVAAYYAGRITSDIGAFMEFKFDGVDQQARVDNIDIRHVVEGQLFGKDVVWGVTVNNAPTVQDAWNSTPVWGFPFNRSPVAPTPMATTLVDGALSQRVVGAGGYVLWNDLFYWEADTYKGLDTTGLRAFGQVPIDDSDRTTTFMPYGRFALIRDWDKHHIEVGAFALSASVIPGGNQTLGLGVRKTDVAFDATYQYITDPTKVTSDRLSAHAIFIHEDARMDAGAAQLLTGALPTHWLDTMRVDVSYSFGATITPAIQYFRTTGSSDINYWATPTGSPNSDGMIFEVAYVPWGKPDSPFPNVNLRLAVQYVNYFTFDGTSANARNNNAFYFSLRTAVKF
jgi:hypothetical protein